MFWQLFPILLLLFMHKHYSCMNVEDEENFQIINPSRMSDESSIETQHTNCRISSSQLTADAQTTITRILTSRCSTKIINERLTNLENLLTSRFDEMRELIYHINHVTREEKNKGDCATNQLYNESPRRWEIKKYNNTIYRIAHSKGVRKVFTYYWTITDIKKKLWTWQTGDSERSSTFYIKSAGYAMFLKFSPKYFPDGTIFTSVGLTSGINDEHLTWPFSHHLQIEILDESPGHLQQPMRSRLWNPTTVCPIYFWERPMTSRDNPECVGLSLPRYFLLSTKKFLWNDSLTVKLIIHL